MSKVEVKHICGHISYHNITDDQGVKNMLNFMGACLCTVCWEKKNEDRNKRNKCK